MNDALAPAGPGLTVILTTVAPRLCAQPLIAQKVLFPKVILHGVGKKQFQSSRTPALQEAYISEPFQASHCV